MASGSEPRSCCPLSPRLITRALAQSVAASAQHCTLSSTPSKHSACTLLGASPLTVSPIFRTVATSEGFQYSTGSPPHTNDARNPGAWALSLKRTNAFNVVSRGHAISVSTQHLVHKNHQACTHFEVKCRYRSEPDEVSVGGSSDPLKRPSSGAAVELPSNTARKSTFASVSYSVKVNV